jgi:hypothetical protein
LVAVAGTGVTEVEAVAATGAHPTQKHAQRQATARKRNCFIVPSEYASRRNTAPKKSHVVGSSGFNNRPIAPVSCYLFFSPFRRFATCLVGVESGEEEKAKAKRIAMCRLNNIRRKAARLKPRQPNLV